MREEARNTDRHVSGWGSTPLRGQTISFVSAGPLKREEDAWNTVSEDDSPQKQSDAEPLVKNVEPSRPLPGKPPLTQHLEPHADKPSAPSEAPTKPEEKEKHSEHQPVLYQDPFQPPQQNGHSVHSSIPIREQPPSPGSDSDEEIVFTGRSTASQPSRRPTPAPLPPATRPSPVPVQPQMAPVTAPKVQAPAPTAQINAPFANTAIDLDSPREIPISTRTRSKRTKDEPFHKSLFGRKYDEDALMQDYIDNMALGESDEEAIDDVVPAEPSRKAYKKMETTRMFTGDGLENAKVQTKKNGTSEKVPKDFPIQAIDWDSDDLADFDDLSTTDEEIEDIDQVIRHRTRASGAQYLVVAEGTEASDAKWMLQRRLVSESAVKEIEIYEEIRKMNIEQDSADETEDSQESEDEEALHDLIDDIESEDDENARIMNHTSRMTDEQIARALAKQEELGWGGDELMLFDGEAPGDDVVEDAFGGGDDFIPFNLAKHTSNRGRSKRNKKQRDSFPSAEAFADALDEDPYGAFDVMDFERPSLKPKKKGRKSDFPWDLEDLDDDLRDQLVSTWTKDREKKAERKRQKEEARLNATLDMAEGGDPAIIKARIRQFLVQDVEVLVLSPMESNIRASVHRLAKALKLNSRSEGKEGLGVGRYPVLTKTPRTPPYTFETIYQVDALMNTRKFFPKSMGWGKNKTPRTPGSARPRRTGGGGVMAGATYRDGDVVGASAPEIGSENKGRAMLEKMGWSAGMGIGAIGNKGSIDHVTHIVKTSKAGLG